MSKGNNIISAFLLISILMMSTMSTFPVKGGDNELEYIFPSNGLEKEKNKDQLVNWLLDGFNIGHDTAEPWKKSNESYYGMYGFNSYRYNITDVISLRLTYIKGYFAQLELSSFWGVHSDPIQNIYDILSIIGVNLNDPRINESKISSSYLPYYNLKGETLGYTNMSSTNDIDLRGFTNSNSIDFREIIDGEHTYSQIIINSWYSGIHAFEGSEPELIEGSLDAFLIMEPDFEKKRSLLSRISTINVNKSTLYYPEFDPSMNIDHYFQHEDEDSVYTVQILTGINNGPIFSYEVNTLTNSSSYWPDNPDHEKKRADGPDIIKLLVAFSTILVMIAALLLILFLSISLLVRRRSKGIMNTLHRKRIFELIQKKPGIHFREIMRELDLKQGVLGYHLNILEEESYIKSIQKGVYRCFYGSDTKSVLHLKLNKAQQKILHEIDRNPGISLSNISRSILKTKTLVYYHTSILHEAGLIDKEKDGKVTSFFITGAGKKYLDG